MQQSTDLEPVWLTRAKRILALAEAGLGFTDCDFDRERYEELSQIARSMLADLGSVPLQRIDGLVPEYAAIYPTPSIDVRGAVIRDGKILLVRERMNGKWSLPGGFADIGYSAAENTEQEAWEESGLRVKAHHLFAVRHKAKHGYPADARDFYKFQFLCRELDEAQPFAGSETSEVGFFAPDALPELSLTRVIPDDINNAFAAAREGRGVTTFD